MPITSTIQQGTLSLAAVTPGNSAIGDAAAAGTSASVARADHKHGREASGTPGASAVGDTASTGTATTVALSDHRHSREAFGTPVNLDASVTSLSAGSLTTVARADHIHTLSNVPVLITKTTLASSASSVTFSNIPQTYTTLEIVWAARSTAAVTNELPYLRINNDSTSKYYRWSAAAFTEYYLSSIAGTGNWFTGLAWNILTISGYASTAHKGLYNTYVYNNSASANNFIPDGTSAIYAGTSALTSITLYASFAAGSIFTLYGRP